MATWAETWRGILAVGDAAPARRLAQGAAYVRSGRVLDLRWGVGALSGRVQGTRATPYLVEIGVGVLDDRAWERVADALAEQVRHSARLLAGHPPEGLDRELERAGVVLFPDAATLETSCACHDRVWPCEHVAAVWEAAATELAADPFLLLRLRGRGRSGLLAELSSARRRRHEAAPETGLDLAGLDVEGWTRARAPLDGVEVARPASPSTPAGTLRLLGDPPGWAGGVDAWRLLGPPVTAGAAWLRTLDPD